MNEKLTNNCLVFNHVDVYYCIRNVFSYAYFIKSAEINAGGTTFNLRETSISGLSSVNSHETRNIHPMLC